MQNDFNYIIKEKFFIKSIDKVLLAVSGGRDSMTMMDLFLKAGIEIGVAHFNHLTRSGESDRDEEFVKTFCAEHNIPFFSVRVDISSHIKKGEVKNFHDLARKLRYAWLETIRMQNVYDYIATGHNRDDHIETFLYRISKGAGLSGLGGIKESNGNIIRPLLGFSRNDIDYYVLKNEISFTEDSSNKKTDYDRNFIRHKIIPEFRNLHENFDIRISTTIQNLRTSNDLYNALLKRHTENYIKEEQQRIIIDKNLFTGIVEKEELLFQLIFKYGFNSDQCTQVIKSFGNNGVNFLAKNYRLTIDRLVFVIEKVSLKSNAILNIEQSGKHVINEINFNISEIEGNVQKSNYNTFYVDADKIKYPVIVRNRKSGDVFHPFGLKGKSTKLKKFLTDKKVPVSDKKNILIFESEGSIFLIAGLEIDYYARITSETKRMLKIEFF